MKDSLELAMVICYRWSRHICRSCCSTPFKAALTWSNTDQKMWQMLCIKLVFCHHHGYHYCQKHLQWMLLAKTDWHKDKGPLGICLIVASGDQCNMLQQMIECSTRNTKTDRLGYHVRFTRELKAFEVLAERQNIGWRLLIQCWTE